MKQTAHIYLFSLLFLFCACNRENKTNPLQPETDLFPFLRMQQRKQNKSATARNGYCSRFTGTNTSRREAQGYLGRADRDCERPALRQIYP